MEKLQLFIKESLEDGKNGHWEEFTDEDTGELVSYWIDDKPEEIVQAVKEATPAELKKLKDLRKAYDKIDDEWWQVNNELSEVKDELHSLKSELREIQYGMEDEIGAAKDDEERDRLGNEYGEQLDNIQKQIRKNVKKIETLSKQKEKLRERIHTASQKLWEYENKIGIPCSSRW